MEKSSIKKEEGISSNRLNTSQPVTVADLKTFKNELLQELVALLTSGTLEVEKKWLKSYEVRKMLKISPGTLQSLKSSGVIPYTKIGGVHLFDAEDIHRLLELGKTTSVP
jgi:hypothetical protein